MKTNGFEYGGIALVIVCGFVVACSGRLPTTSSAAPPPPPSGPPAASSSARTFAVSTIFLGDTSRKGDASTAAWKSYGYDLDGKTTTKTSVDVCTPFDSSDPLAQVDGDLGTDNTWGSRIVPLLQTIEHDVSARMTATIRRGAFTYLVQTEGLTDDPMQTNTLVSGQVFLSAPLDGTPTFTQADSWPALARSLATGQVGGGAKSTFRASYVTGGLWVSAPAGDLVLHIDLGTTTLAPIELTIHGAIVTFAHTSPDRLTNGTIAGVISTEELAAASLSVVRRLSAPACAQRSSFDVASLIRAASDMPLYGPNVVGVPCNAVSIGIGFEAEEVANVTQVREDPAPPPDPCDAGADAASAADAADAGRD